MAALTLNQTNTLIKSFHVQFSNSQASYLGHFAENDPFEPLSSVEHLIESLERAGRPVTIHIYPNTGHWFFEPDRADAYNESAAKLAWARTITFLEQTNEKG